ncbi:MAG: nicotinamide riboside transporter PnuC [Reichenbachiella sp.]
MMDIDLTLEVVSVVLGLVYLILLMKENILCWFFGVASSLTSILLFYRTGLYSESILYIYYSVIGVYGYVIWHRASSAKDKLKIRRIAKITYFYIIGLGIACAALLGYYFDTYSDANIPYVDAGTTIFSFIASYLEANKFIDSWLFWIVINMVTLVLYYNLNLRIYALLTLIYLIFSFVGYYKWGKKLNS